MKNKKKRVRMMRRKRWKKLYRQYRLLFHIGGVTVIICLALLAGVLIRLAHQRPGKEKESYSVDMDVNPIPRPVLDVELLTVNEYSRPGTLLDEIKGIVVHYTANPGTSAMQNRNYFEGLKDAHNVKASSHFIIGLDGEIVQCIPCAEMSYASNSKNSETISIECCHSDLTGKFNTATYQSLVHLTAWLCCEYHIDIDNVIRHYDVTGKNCPKYYVEHENKWKEFKEDVKDYISKCK